VPYGECYYYTTDSMRQIIGDTCEQCSSDDDCVAGHTYKYYYNGKYYGAEATTATQISLYGCKNYGQRCVNKDVLPSIGEKCFAYAIDSRCEVIATVPVQCIPGSSTCGTNAFCDPNTFTCKSTAECVYDWECGTGTTCDYTTKTLKTPKCSSGKCTWVTQSVECCYDVNCPDGYMCSQEHKCVKIINPKTNCPYECCVNDPDYFDKKCPNDIPCIDHKCTEYQKCNNNGICEPEKGENSNNCPSDCKEFKFDWSYVWAGLAGLLAFLIIGRKDIEEKKWVGITIAGIIAFIIAIIVWWIAENWVMIAISLGLLAILGGVAMWLIPGLFTAILTIFAVIIGTIRR
jgi:hypothetical protein